MGANCPLNEHEKEQIKKEKLLGKSLSTIAQELGRSPGAVRKWWRRWRDGGNGGLHARSPGRRPSGEMSHFDDRVLAEALNLKQLHHGWGAGRVLVELRKTEALAGLALPSRSRLAATFKAKCPDCLATYHLGHRHHPAPAPASAVNEVWQIDSQEQIRLQDGEMATICTIRDPYAAVIWASQAHLVTKGSTYRKVTWQEMRSVIRKAMTEAGMTPERFRMDNEHCMVGNPHDPYPSSLILWLVGLGIVVETIRPHCPTDQAQIERTHRTLDNWAVDATGQSNLESLQQALDRERNVHNHDFPSHASDCKGRPPFQAHPDLLCSHRPYCPEMEGQLFSIDRVYDYLADLDPIVRKVGHSGAVKLGGRQKSIGKAYSGKNIWVNFDAQKRMWACRLKKTTFESDRDSEPIGFVPAPDINVHFLTGCDFSSLIPAPISFQLPLPFLAVSPRGTHL